eukprot:2993565-Amphidinium_carterae.1
MMTTCKAAILLQENKQEYELHETFRSWEACIRSLPCYEVANRLNKHCASSAIRWWLSVCCTSSFFLTCVCGASTSESECPSRAPVGRAFRAEFQQMVTQHHTYFQV